MKKIVQLLIAAVLLIGVAMAQTPTKPTGAVSVGVNYFRVASTDSVYSFIPGINLYYNMGIWPKINLKIADKVDKIAGKGLSTEDYSTTEKSKLSGVATGATANQSDAYLLARPNHTGTQPVSTVAGLQTELDGKIPLTQKGAANGVATLGADGKVPNSQIPALAISETFVVASQAAMLAISGADQGDVAVRTDISKSFILTASPASTLGNWQELLAPTDAVQSVNGQVGNVNLTTTDISEGTNKYYTEAKVNANTNVAANTAARHVPVTIGTANGLSLSTQALSLGLSSGSTNGALSSTDWTTFNSKQAAGSYALTNGTSATGTWPIGITGNAATATQWGGRSAILNAAQSAFDYFLTLGSDGIVRLTNDPSSLRLALGSPSGGETFPSVVARNSVSSIGITVPIINIKETAATGSSIIMENRNSTQKYSFTVDATVVDDKKFALVDATNGVVRIAVSDAGNVGIGTISPSAKLDVNGAGKFAGGLTLSLPGEGNATVIESGNDPASYGWGIQQDEITTGDWYLRRKLAGVYSTALTMQRSTGNATFAGNITAPTATIGTTTIGNVGNNIQSNTSHLFLRPTDASGAVLFQNPAATVNWGFVDANGFNGNVVGNVTGSASQWGGNTFVGSASDVAPNYLAGYYAGAEAKYSTQTAVRSFLGLGSNAYTSTAYAPLASPALTGTPTTPTATAGTNTTQIASTAFVLANSVTTTGNQSIAGVKTFTGTVALPGNITMSGYVATRQYDTRLLGFTPSDGVARPFLIDGSAPTDGQVLTHDGGTGTAKWSSIGKVFIANATGNLIINSFSFAHGLSYTPTMVLITPMNYNSTVGSGNSGIFATVDATNVIISTGSDFASGALKWTVWVK